MQDTVDLEAVATSTSDSIMLVYYVIALFGILLCTFMLCPGTSLPASPPPSLCPPDTMPPVRTANFVSQKQTPVSKERSYFRLQLLSV